MEGLFQTSGDCCQNTKSMHEYQDEGREECHLQVGSHFDITDQGPHLGLRQHQKLLAAAVANQIFTSLPLPDWARGDTSFMDVLKSRRRRLGFSAVLTLKNENVASVGRESRWGQLKLPAGWGGQLELEDQEPFIFYFVFIFLSSPAPQKTTCTAGRIASMKCNLSNH